MSGATGSSFAALLRELRTERGMTLEELSEKSGVSDRSIGNMERGYTLAPRRRTVAVLADALELATDQRRLLTEMARSARTVPATRGTTVVSGPMAPPRRPPVFVGREDEVRALSTALRRDNGGGPPAAVTVYGPPGAGKTTLALHVAERLRDAFPDGVLFVDLGGTDENPPSPSSVVLTLLSGMGLPDGDLLQEDTGARMRRYQALLENRRQLIILDNAAGEGQVRPLLPYTGRTAIVITARHPLSGLETARTALGPLHRGDSVALLASLIGQERTSDTANAEVVAELCADLPLALRIAANWLVTRESWGVAQLVDRLRDEDRRISALSAGDLALGPAFSLSYRRLTPEAAAALRALGTTAPHDVGPALLAATLDISDGEAMDLLDELVEAGWLRTSRPGRYRIYDLLRLYARQRLVSEEGPDAATALQDRAQSWLLSRVRAAGRCFEPGHGPDPGVPADHPAASQENADAWLRAEAGHWLEAVRRAAAGGRHHEVVDTAEALHWFSDSWMLWEHWTELFRSAAVAAHAMGDPRMEATHRNYLAWALVCLDRDPEGALEQARAALKIAEDCGDAIQQAWSHFYASWALREWGRPGEAAEAAAAAAAMFTEADDPNGLVSALGAHVFTLLQADRIDDAVPVIERTTAILVGPTADERVPGHVRGYAWATAMQQRAHVAMARGRWEEAEQALREARDYAVRPRRAALHHGRLAYVLDKLGRHEEAARERVVARSFSDHAEPDPLLERLAAAEG
ncbi:ATP-binding protein [Streptomyces sp. enrichment culture]|uniref:ATP-binding protein n=1 Tax=Streptomyces sp. enrichment culture TaxID=1795815 RepID=UPI003F57FE2B